MKLSDNDNNSTKILKLYFEYITLNLYITHYNKTNHIYILNIYIANYTFLQIRITLQ